ncbi:Rrf2 family transcriptional regulator [Prauserella marina]|uniref:Rrf2 family protein n=1 Tax=Prauserella marina TaxID=530584 RepID=A0A222VRR4_9PSEU|nr:Rrf2 family transcriptional regulator [Prauserella marina]ASR36532.1 Rrf2 family transcriptional regulator [Prauserella marina]PWV73926.1 BadM/Rrf2 family transcriptional regulator [Prauserella marina]SDD59074.1 Rrf2 family protein [Prauserella marina]
MKLPESTEWALHCTTALAQLGGEPVSTSQLAEHFGLPVPYLAKQLAHLVKAGVLSGTTGPRGGFRLALPATRITVLDIVEAIDGRGDPYQCREIRQQGRGAVPAADCLEPCVLATTMRAAHEAWRASLAAVTVAELVGTLPPEIPQRTRRLLSRGGGE